MIPATRFFRSFVCRVLLTQFHRIDPASDQRQAKQAMEQREERTRCDERNTEPTRVPPSNLPGPPQGDYFASLAPTDSTSTLDATTRQQQLLQMQARQIMQAQLLSLTMHTRTPVLPPLMHPAATTFIGREQTRFSQPNILATSASAWSSDLPANSILSDFSLQHLQMLLSQQRVTGINQHHHTYNAHLSSYLSILENTHLPRATQRSCVTESSVTSAAGFLPNPRHHREAFIANAPVAGNSEITQPYLSPMINCSLQVASRQEPLRAASAALGQTTDQPCKRIHGKEARPAAVASQDAHPRQVDGRFSCPPGSVEVEVKARRRYRHECFPEKLHRLIREATEDGNDHIIAWLPDGNGFEIHSLEAFERFLIPAYFRHQKLASFRRQLSMYGFRRDSSKQDARRYVHLWFHRDHPERCKSVKRLSDYQLVLMQKKK